MDSLFWYDFEFTSEFLRSDSTKPLKEIRKLRTRLSHFKHSIDQHYVKDSKNNAWNNVSDDMYPWLYVSRSGPKRISRAFYKLSEILINYKIPNPRTAICLCEAPGGFVECLRYFYKGVAWRAWSLGGSIPFSKKLPQATVRYHDILNTDSLVTSPANLITADGGADSSSDYDSQETINYPIIKAQIDVARKHLAPGGTFIIKFFDTYTFETLRVILWLNELFEVINVCKPPGSKPTNSEKYIVCRKFKGVEVALEDVEWTQESIPNIINYVIIFAATLQIESITEVLSQINTPKNIDFRKYHEQHLLKYKGVFS
uniref:Ribosomal RNA methyltransferase FtsJ domain-containing protein n=1 Tax=viral metagenome TaxID=1070528 RepID=A0A6C0KCG5_9ZZZZ